MPDPIVERAHAFLRSHTRGELRFDEHVRPMKYVIAPDGRLVMPVMVAMLAAVETVLFVPEYGEEALELLVTLAAFEESGPDGALVDRWRIYHGEPDDVRWAFVDLDAARLGEHVVDGEALVQANPLAEAEPALCRRLNEAGHEALRRLCAERAGCEVQKPVAVGVDPGGIDVRRRFDVI
ncbi:MAG: hypothetical protein ACYTJ0_20485, partial [Planctomycetota bacterium]